jgi:hypothetical protein
MLRTGPAPRLLTCAAGPSRQIPVDLVVKAILLAAVQTARDGGAGLRIYHSGTSTLNPVALACRLQLAPPPPIHPLPRGGTSTLQCLGLKTPHGSATARL